MENTKKKCEDYQPCNIKNKDGYCMNNDLRCIWHEGACADTSEKQLTIPDVSNCYMADCLIQDSCLRFKQQGCNKDCKLYM